MRRGRLRGIPAFGWLATGQTLSFFGSQVSAFGVGVWIYETTGSATLFGLISFSAVLPVILLSPVAGALMDRFDRKWGMIASDSMGAVAALLLAYWVMTGDLQVWHVFLVAALGSITSAFQEPAFTASVTLMVPKTFLNRANGIVQAGVAAAQILGPLAAGALLHRVGLMTLVAVDLVTYVTAVAILMMIHIPRPASRAVKTTTEPDAPGESAEAASERGVAVTLRSLGHDLREGLQYLGRRRGLVALMVLALGLNFSFGVINVLLTPLVLSFATPEDLGFVLAALGIGMLLGGLGMSLWRGPRRRLPWILGILAFQGIVLAVGVLRPSVIQVLVGGFVFMLFSPVAASLSQALWQSKIDPGIQARVFSLRTTLVSVAMAGSYLTAGPLADNVFGPLLAPGGGLADSVGRLVGVGPGRGIAFLMVLTGLTMTGLVLMGWLYPPLRRLEIEVPDAVPDDPPLPLTETVECT